jgi:hypothetical protein
LKAKGLRYVHLEPWQWCLAGLGALAIGLSKTGLPGVGILAVALFANVFDPIQSVGLVLPLLISADIAAVASYRQHADWKELKRLFPWAACGIILGWGLLKAMNRSIGTTHSPGETAVNKLIGLILMGMVVLHIWRKRHPKAEDIPHGPLWAPSMGLLGGFTTMLANAAGPVMTLYLLSANLPKLAFMGTSAWYFCVLNIFKVPFYIDLGMINISSISVDAYLAPIAVTGALAGRALLPRINQQAFEFIALAFTCIAGCKLLVWDLLAKLF